MSKKKNNSTGSLKGFILLVIIIAAALYLYQNNDTARSASLKQQVEQTVDNAIQYVEKISEDAKENRQKDIASKLEIPVSPQKLDEIRLTRTAYTKS